MTRAAVLKEVEDKKNRKDTTESRGGRGVEWWLESHGERMRARRCISFSRAETMVGEKDAIKV